VKPGDPGDEPVPAVPDLGTLDGGVPAALLLVEPTEPEVHLPMELLVGVGHRAEALGALAMMDILLGHGPTLREAVSKSISAYQERGTCSWMAPTDRCAKRIKFWLM